METYCILAEKKDMAKGYADAMYKGGIVKNKPIEYDSHIVADEYLLTWARGHLLELAMPLDYGIQPYVRENLPIFPEKFKLIPISIKDKDGVNRTDPYVEKQLKTIKRLFNDATCILVATDAGREGELIFRYIYEHTGIDRPFKRVWVKNKTTEGITEALKTAKDGHLYDKVAEAAKARSFSDWLVGINASQALAISAQAKGLSLGRVQTPVLAMVCKRFIENTQFNAVPFFVVKIKINLNGHLLSISSPRFSSKAEAETFLMQIKNVEYAQIQNFKIGEKKEQSPLLHDLPSLQKTANKLHKMSIERIDTAADSLYHKGLLSYPRTSSRYIEPEDFKYVPQLIKNAEVFNKTVEWFDENAFNVLDIHNLNTNSVDTSKIDDHGALITTSKLPQMEDLNTDEAIVYRLVVQRLLEAFAPPAIFKTYMADILIDTNKFSINSADIQHLGYKSFAFDKQIAEEENEDYLTDGASSGNLVALKVFGTKNNTSESAEVVERIIDEGKTKPKPLYTEGTLIAAMQTCGKEITEADFRESIKESGIGMPSTRGKIIRNLFEREYVALKKDKIVPTEKGLAVYEIVKNNLIASASMTGQWEDALKKIEVGEMTKEQFLGGIKNFTSKITQELLTQEIIINTANQKIEIGTCPKCKTAPVLSVDTAKAYFCAQKDCTFLIPKEIAKKQVSPQVAQQLISEQQTDILTGFVSKENKKFSAALKLSTDYKVDFQFEVKSQSQIKSKKKFKIKTLLANVKDESIEKPQSLTDVKLDIVDKALLFKQKIEELKKTIKGPFDKAKVSQDPINQMVKCSVILTADITKTEDKNNIHSFVQALANHVFQSQIANKQISEIKVNIYLHNERANFECIHDIHNAAAVKKDFRNLNA